MPNITGWQGRAWLEVQVIDTLLFDLDGTLLDIDMDIFLEHYLQSLTKRFEGIFLASELVSLIMAGTRAMIADSSPDKTNAEVFWEYFFSRVDYQPEDILPLFAQFYDEDFPRLAHLTSPKPEARQVLERALKKGFRLALATNPVFPRQAVVERLRWAGLEEIPFAVITSYENMHACKPHLAYYREILAALDAEPRRCLMFGNDVAEDLPVAQLGVRTYLVEDHLLNMADRRFEPDYRGRLADVVLFLDRLDDM